MKSDFKVFCKVILGGFLLYLIIVLLSSCEQNNDITPSSPNPVPIVQDHKRYTCRFWNDDYGLPNSLWQEDGCGLFTQQENVTWSNTKPDARAIAAHNCSECDSIRVTLQ